MKPRRKSSHDQDRNWIIAHHARLNGHHDEFVRDGFSFASDRLRFWRCKDGSISIRLVYEKEHHDCNQDNVVLLRLSNAPEGKILIEMRALHKIFKAKS